MPPVPTSATSRTIGQIMNGTDRSSRGLVSGPGHLVSAPAFTKNAPRVTLPIVSLFIACAMAVGLFVLLRVHRRLATSLREVERQAETLAEQAQLLDLAHDAIMVWDMRSGEIRFWNAGAEQLYGWQRDEVLGRTPGGVLATRFPQPLAEINAELVRDGRWEGELVHTRRDGSAVVVSSRWALQVNPHGEPDAVLGINTDVTSRKAAEEALQFQALHDSLTGLPNRVLFDDRLARALDHADRARQRVAVFFLDLDNFKVINDSLGHQAGDGCWSKLAQRVRGCLRSGDTRRALRRRRIHRPAARGARRIRERPGRRSHPRCAARASPYRRPRRLRQRQHRHRAEHAAPVAARQPAAQRGHCASISRSPRARRVAHCSTRA